MASEGFLLGIAVILLILEYPKQTSLSFFVFDIIVRNRRSSNKDKAKEEKIKSRFEQLENESTKQQQEIDLLKSQLEQYISQSNLSIGATNSVKK